MIRYFETLPCIFTALRQTQLLSEYCILKTQILRLNFLAYAQRSGKLISPHQEYTLVSTSALFLVLENIKNNSEVDTKPLVTGKSNRQMGRERWSLKYCIPMIVKRARL